MAIQRPKSVDIAIVGGGPAGLGAAICAARTGASVMVLERRTGTIDKACGEGLMPGGVVALAELGISISHYRPFVGIRYVSGDVHADGHFPGQPGWGIRRTVLHQALRERALALGVDIRTHSARALRQDRTGVDIDIENRPSNMECGDDGPSTGYVRARHVIAADGLRSPIRHQLGLDAPPRYPPRFGVRRHFQVAPWSRFVEVHWSPLAEAYVTPVDDQLVGVAILFGEAQRARLRGGSGAMFERLLAGFPALAERCTVPASTVRGAGPFAMGARRRVQGRIMLVGDAAGYLDPLTGEGIRLGLASGAAAVAAILAGRPEAYEQHWRSINRRFWWLTGALLRMQAVPPVRRATVPVLRRVPGLFDRILAMLEAV